MNKSAMRQRLLGIQPLFGNGRKICSPYDFVNTFLGEVMAVTNVDAVELSSDIG